MASIIPEKFQSKEYKGAQDWVNSFITDRITGYKIVTRKTTSKDEEGNDVVTETETQRANGMDNDKLVALAVANGIDTSKIDLSAKNAPGRARMTWGNSLRALARANKGLRDFDGSFVAASDEFIASIPEKKTAAKRKAADRTPEEKAAAEDKRQQNFEKMQAASKIKRMIKKAEKETRELTDEENTEIAELREKYGIAAQ